jgi:hypothetical protein
VAYAPYIQTYADQCIHLTHVHSGTRKLHTVACYIHAVIRYTHCTLANDNSYIILLLHIATVTHFNVTDAPGCIRSAHVPKECMLYIHAEGGPPVIVNGSSGNSSINSSDNGLVGAADNVLPIQVFKHLEINIFPGTSYTLVLQVCDIDYMHAYVYFNCIHSYNHQCMVRGYMPSSLCQ